MKVTNNSTNSLAPSGRSREAAAARPGNSTEADSKAGGSPSDRAQLSKLSGYLSAALSGSASHNAKVSALGAAVSNGDYSVDASAVSESIIQHRLLFGGAW